MKNDNIEGNGGEMEEKYVAIILERVENQYAAIQEGLAILQDVPMRLDRIDDRLESLELDTNIIKLAVRDHSGDLAALKAKAA